ncbi:Conidiation protein 6-domain-containing protein [Fomes fomentarius]|nr:Conidiation protein 6-domain-containing protein [Fomes fomentarius]
MSLPTRQMGGHKAAINNPRVSEEAKERSRQAIDELEADPATRETREGYEAEDQKDSVRQNAGYKATLKNPNVSEEARNNAREILEDRDAL